MPPGKDDDVVWVTTAITAVLLVVLVGGLVSSRRRGRVAFPLPPLELEDASRVGRVWTNNDPLIVVDAEAAETWTGIDGDYDRIYDHPLRIGGREAYAAMPEVDEGPVEVFSSSAGDVLLVSVAAANRDALDWDEFFRAAGRTPARLAGRVEVTSGRLAVFHATAARRELTVVEGPKAGAAPFADELLLVPLPSDTYAVRESVVEGAGYALNVWRLAR